MTNTRVAPPVLVKGTIVFPAGASVKGAVAFVRLRDVTMVQDWTPGAPAVNNVLAETVVSNIDSGETNEFQLSGEIVNWCGTGPRANYAVEVHVKVNTDPANPKYEAVEVGDYLSMSSNPVVLHTGKPAEVAVQVDLVKH